MNILHTTLICPACQAKFKLADATRNLEVLEIARLAARFGPDWSLVESYLACFRTEKGKGIHPKRLYVLMQDLVVLWETRNFSRKGKTYQIHADVLRAGVKAVGQLCDTKFGFRDHAYLLEVLSRKQKEFSRAQAKAENLEFRRDLSGASRDDDDSVLPPADFGSFLPTKQTQPGGQDGKEES